MNAFRSEYKQRSRQGYTLIELLIAAVLVSALMSSVWGIMSMYNSFLSAGQAKTTEQQLVRSLFQLMAEDLSTVLTPLDERKISEASLSDDEAAFIDLFGEEEEGLDSEDEMLEERSVFEQETKVTHPAAPLFLGTSTAIRITTRRALFQEKKTEESEIDQLNELGGGSFSEEAGGRDETSPSVSEFQTVVYQFHPPGLESGPDSLPSGLYRIQVDALDLFALVNNRSTAQENRITDDVQVDRITLESLLFPQEDRLTSAESEFLESAEEENITPHYDLVPEVVDCKFEYFDGKNWFSEWPSGENSEVSSPMAVRIQFDVINAEELEKLKQEDSPEQNNNEIEQELNDSFSGGSDQTTNNPGASTNSGGEGALEDRLEGITARRYWRIILLENPVPAYNGLESSSLLEEGSSEGFSE